MNIEIIENLSKKLCLGYLDLLLRSKELAACKRNIFLVKFTLWRSELERCVSGVLKDEFECLLKILLEYFLFGYLLDK